MDFDVKFLIKFSACVLIGFGLAVFSPQLTEKYNALKQKNITDTLKPTETKEDSEPSFKNLPTPDVNPPDSGRASDEESLKNSGYAIFTPGQDTYSCPDMSILVKHIQDVIKTKNIYTQTDTKTYPPAIMYRTSSSRPFYRLSPAHSYVITAEDNKINALGPDITTTFTEKLQAQKFTLRSENSMADIYYGYSLTSFEKDGWLYTIELGQGSNAGIGIELTCAPSSIKDSQAARDFDEIADAQSQKEHYSPFNIFNTWTYTDNVYTISVNRMFSNGHAEYWGKVNGTWEFLTSTQDLPACQPFIENKVGKGIQCYKCEKGYDPTTKECAQPVESTVTY